jgi:predicted DNA-binding transcriptional regulator
MAVLLEDVLLHVLRDSMNPLSLKELQVKVLPRPVTPIMLAASLNRLCRRGEVVKELVGKGRAHYVYSAKPAKLVGVSKRGDV